MTCCQKMSRSKPVMGATMRISTLGLHGFCAMRVIRKAFDAVEAFEASVNTGCVDSELMRLLAAPIGESHYVSKSLWQMLRVANEIAYRSDGVLDIAASGTAGAASWTDIDLSVKNFVRLMKPLQLELTSIAKGYAVDVAVRALEEAGVGRGIVDLDGCIRAFGPQEWRIHFNLGVMGEASLPITLRGGALACFGPGYGETALYDTREGMLRAREELGASNVIVRAPSAALANSLTGVAALMQVDAAKVLKGLGARGLVLTPDGPRLLESALS